MAEGALYNPELASLRDGDAFEGFYVIKEASFQTAVNGKNYIRLTLSDASGSVGGNVWDANKEIFADCPAGSVVKVQAQAESYKGRQQIRIGRMRPAHSSEVDFDSFLPRSKRDAEEMRRELLAHVESIKDKDYLALAEAFFGDKALLERFLRSPAARDVHHAYLGGLVEHTLSMAAMAAGFAAAGSVNRDLLLLGVLLHDVGKTEELSAKLSIEYTDRGKLIGHLSIGAEMCAERAAGIPNFPRTKLHLVQHLILSHHGRYEYGSPVLPKIPEAFALHHIDNLDAKVMTANRLLSGIQDPESHWTEYNRALETALFRAELPTGETNG